jgi:branched-chain amino acid aminotransferase
VTVWVNGISFEDDKAALSVFDHGTVAGDGIFETVKVTGGLPFALSRHLARLTRSAAGMGLPEPDTGWIRDGVRELLEADGHPAAARIRITVTAGIAPLGSQRGEGPGNVVIALGRLDASQGPCDVVTAPWPRNERGVLAGIKTTSYAENVLALRYAAQHHAAEAIFANIAGHLCEGTGTNVFVVSGGRLSTPRLSSGCLDGVTRALVIEWSGAVEEDLPAAALAAADEAFLAGTTRDVQPIRRVDGELLPAAPGPVTAKAAEVFAARSAANPDP